MCFAAMENERIRLEECRRWKLESERKFFQKKKESERIRMTPRFCWDEREILRDVREDKIN
jgi:hypothetical protein